MPKAKGNGMTPVLSLLAALMPFVEAGPDPCTCKFAGDVLPEAAWEAAGNPLFGTYCRAWNHLPGVDSHLDDTVCPPSQMCTQNCNYMQIPWCYVDSGCIGYDHTATSLVGLSETGVSWSYAVCGAHDCGADWVDHLCPAGPGCKHDHHCRCLFEGMTLPTQTADATGNPLYGTHCEMEWDELLGTEVHNPACMGDDADHCSKECNWHQAHHCYVEVGCEGLDAEDIVVSDYSDDLAEAAGVEAVGYSYAMCNYANCYGENFDTNPDCPFGEGCTTCGMVKHDYKTGDCCHHPDKHITIHHMFHEVDDFADWFHEIVHDGAPPGHM